MRTNRDLDKGIKRLLKAQEPSTLSLESYLVALIARARRFADRESVTLNEFLSLLEEGFDGPGKASPRQPSMEFQKWQVEVEQQIEDLRQMAQNGQLENEDRYFGISAPSGRSWYNFDPCTYLECGVAGFSANCLLGGSMAKMPKITWEMFSIFLWCGQNYE